MKQIYKSFLVVGLGAVVLTLSACGTETPNVNDNMDTQEEGVVANTTTNQPAAGADAKKLNLGEFSAQTSPDAGSATLEEETTPKAASTQVVSTEKQANLLSDYSGAVIKTNKGDITVKFYNDESPVTVNNFLNLSQSGFYNGSKFHRVIKDFMIQGGDPNSKDDDWSNDGFGGPGYYFKDEINTHKLVAGSLAMANSGAGTSTNGSQFFIVTAESTPWLDGAHTNFGQVTSGLEIVAMIQNVAVNENDHPTEDVTIIGIELLK